LSYIWGKNVSRVAIVTGGAKRLGRAICLQLAESGYDIALHFNHSVDAARETKKEIENLGQRCLLCRGNLSETVFSRQLINTVVEAFGPPGLLVNNASIFKKTSFQGTDQDLFDVNIDLHIKAPFFLSQSFSHHCDKGAIINMLDTRVEGYQTEHFLYTLTKKALKEMTLLLARELAPRIRVNGICPGPILAPEQSSSGYLVELAGETPMEMPGKISDVLTALNYLVQSDYVNGEILYVDGGQQLL
jgi:pteridine reductase